MSETIEKSGVSKDWTKKMQTGKGITKPTVAYLPTREASNQPKVETPVITAPAAQVVESPAATIETPSAEVTPAELPNKVVVTPNTILVDEQGNSISVEAAKFFNYKKENWDRAASAIQQGRKDIADERARLDQEVNSPLVKTARAIREANPNFTEEQVQLATVRALGLTQQETKKDEPKPRPAPPSGAMQGDPEWAQYERDDRQWLNDELDRRNEERLKPLLETVESTRKQTEAERRQTQIAARNKAIIDSRWDHLPFDKTKITPEQEEAINEAIINKAAQRGMYFDSQSLAAKELDEEKFGLIVESLYPIGSVPPGANPSEVLAAKLNNGIPLVEKAQPKPPPAPGLQDKSLTDKPKATARNQKDDWYGKLNGV